MYIKGQMPFFLGELSNYITGSRQTHGISKKRHVTLDTLNNLD